MELITNRCHVYIDGTYENRESPLIVYCPIHGNEHTTTFHNYSRSVTGMSCCGKKVVSEKLLKRQFSPETIEKMKIAATQRPARGGKPRRWRENHDYRKWREAVLKKDNNQCVVTGLKKEKIGDLEVHHLYGTKTFPKLALEVNNGIVLHKKIHTFFHQKYGYANNTLEQFLSFLLFLSKLFDSKNQEFMPISSQGELQNSQGSETRVDDPLLFFALPPETERGLGSEAKNRIMKLQERLEQIQGLLTKFL